MNSTTKFIAALGVATIAGSSTLGAQAVDARWQAWMGCWAPVAGENGLPRELGGGAGTRVCVVPAQGTSAVDIVTLTSGKVTDRTHLEVDGNPHPVSRDGCTGTETARWAAVGGMRVYLNTTLACTGGVQRHGNSVLAFTQRYEWLDVRGMTSREASGVAVVRYSATDDTTGIPADIRAQVGTRSLATNNAVLAASAPMTLADIADVAMFADSGVTATWLMERTQGLKLSINATQLVALADQGVPSSVIDVVVAIAHPDVFALNPNSRDADFKPRATNAYGSRNAYDVRSAYGYPMSYGGYMFGFGYGYSPYSLYGGYGGYSPYGYYGYSPFGYSPYGYGYGYPYYGYYYPGTQPIIVVNRGSDTPPSVGDGSSGHGRVVKGQGYSSPSSSGSSSGGGSSTSSSGGGSGGSSGAASSGGSATTGGSSSSGTAVRKPPR